MHRPNPGSLNATLNAMQVGERVFLESTPESYSTVQRQVSSKTRRPSCMAGMTFSTNVYTAVQVQAVGKTVILVCVERLT